MIKKILKWVKEGFMLGGLAILIIGGAFLFIAVVLICLILNVCIVAAPFILAMYAWKWIFG